jgi:hypothetical protein
MECGSDEHAMRADVVLVSEPAEQMGGPGGSNREEWADPEPIADDDHEPRPSPADAARPGDPVDDGGGAVETGWRRAAAGALTAVLVPPAPSCGHPSARRWSCPCRSSSSRQRLSHLHSGRVLPLRPRDQAAAPRLGGDPDLPPVPQHDAVDADAGVQAVHGVLRPGRAVEAPAVRDLRHLWRCHRILRGARGPVSHGGISRAASTAAAASTTGAASVVPDTAVVNASCEAVSSRGPSGPSRAATPVARVSESRAASTSAAGRPSGSRSPPR